MSSDKQVQMPPRHTPGPWRASVYGGDWYVFAADSAMVADHHDDDLRHVARMRGVGRGAEMAEMEANARLIATAPRLLAALREALTYINECELVDVTPSTRGTGYRDALAVLDEAEGRHQ